MGIPCYSGGLGLLCKLFVYSYVVALSIVVIVSQLLGSVGFVSIWCNGIDK